MDLRIPFNKPFVVGKELFYVAQAVISGRLAGDGEFTRRCNALLEDKLGAHKVLLTTSCTHALEMSALLCDIGPGDEVILPSYTFVSTANAFVLRGATPVFVDIEPTTMNLDAELVEGAISEKTKAIVPVHYAGVGCDMKRLGEIAQERGLHVIEDAAQGLNATQDGRHLGTIGTFGCLSFHETKNCIAGEAGALLINDPRFVERAEIIREKGTNRCQFFRGEVDKYTWLDAGSSYLPSEVVAAFLFAQLESMYRIDERRLEIYRRYQEGLRELAEQGHLRLPENPRNTYHNAHLFYLLCKDAETRRRLTAFLRDRGIQAPFHYVPLHSSPMGRKVGRLGSSMQVTEELWERLIRLPLYYELTLEEQVDVLGAVRAFYES